MNGNTLGNHRPLTPRAHQANRSKPRRSRPAVFRALGHADPPESVEVDGRRYMRRQVVKHDSWAATAIYQLADERIVCKFNRRQSIWGLPAAWLGWWLAYREARMFQRLEGDPNIPHGCGPVYVDGRRAWNAAAHVYVAGRTLLEAGSLSERDVQELHALLTRLHQKRIAYVDLHKLDNILIADEGKPYLIDFQISLWLPRFWPVDRILSGLHRLDRYHLLKHVSRLRPDLCDARDRDWVERKPFLIRVHRTIATPYQRARRSLFVRLGVRTGAGEASTELPPDPAARLRRTTPTAVRCPVVATDVLPAKTN